MQLAQLPPLQRAAMPAEMEGTSPGGPAGAAGGSAPRPCSGGWGPGAVVAAPTPARPPPGSLMAPRQPSGAAVALAEAEGHLHLDSDQQHLSFCFYGRQEYQSTQTRSGSFSISSVRPEAVQAPNFRIGCCMQARSISAQGQPELAKTGQPPLAFRMCSTKSSTSIISSFSIKKLSSLKQCSHKLHNYWCCCQRSFSLPFSFSHNTGY